jgi:hypothetical protein
MAWNLPERKRRLKAITFHVNSEELESIMRYFSKSTFTILSEYAREKTLGHKVQIKYRNASLDDFLKEMVPLKEALIDVLHGIGEAGFKWEQEEKDILSKKVDDILEKLIKIYHSCLSESA